jgi:hypothetical protein
MTRLGLALLFFAALMLAANADEPDDFSAIEVCRDFSLIARDVMTARQNKEPMSEILPATIKRFQKWAEEYGREMSSQEAEEMSAPLVMAAYDATAYPDGSPWNGKRQDAIRDFENDMFEQCYEEWTSE